MLLNIQQALMERTAIVTAVAVEVAVIIQVWVVPGLMGLCKYRIRILVVQCVQQANIKTQWDQRLAFLAV